MKYLILSPLSLSMFIVPRLAKSKDVEKIFFYTHDKTYANSGKSMQSLPFWNKMELVSDYSKVINENKPSELVIFIDDVGFGQTGKHLRELGYKVIGGSPLTDRIEDERQFATDLMSRIMDVPPSTSFTKFEDGIKFVKSQEKDTRLVFKPNDSEVPKEYTYVSKDIPDMVEAMQGFKNEWKWKEDFQIQEFIKGTEVDFNAYFNGKEFLENSMTVYFENKPMMDDDIGPATGGAIAVALYRAPKGIFWDILNKLKPALAKEGYVGQLSINSIVSEEDHKPYFLEFCGRVGYPSFPIEITLIEDAGKSLHDLFVALVTGTQAPEIFPLDKIGVTTAVFVPPAPNPSTEDIKSTKDTPISWSEEWDKYFFPYNVMYNEKQKKMVLCGTGSWVLQVTCADSTLDGAVSMLYDTYMPTLTLKNKMYRSDAGRDAKKRIKALKDFGLL